MFRYMPVHVRHWVAGGQIVALKDQATGVVAGPMR